MKEGLGPKQLAWCRAKWQSFRDLEMAVERIRRELELTRARSSGAV